MNNMNNLKNTLLLAAAIATLLTSVNSVSAGEQLLSPRARANQPSVGSCACNDADLVRGQNDLGVAAKSKASGGQSVAMGASKANRELPLVQSARIGSPKGLQQFPEGGREFQVAPLK